MKAKELRLKTAEELAADEQELRKELFNLRFQSATENLENPRRIREIRRDIARILTILGQRKQGA
jgi:large subunit ribosomal protein L29